MPFLHSNTWAALGLRLNETQLLTPIIAGRTLHPVSNDAAKAWAARISAVPCTAEDTAEYYTGIITTGVAAVERANTEVAAEIRRLRALVRAEGEAAAQRADAATLAGLADDIGAALRLRPDANDLRPAEVLSDEIEDLRTNGERLDFPTDALDAALAALNAVREIERKQRAVLDELSTTVAGLIAKANSPSTIQAVRERGQELEVRQHVPAIAGELAALRGLAADLAARIDALASRAGALT